jgi:D-xylonolactonase
VSVFDYDPTTGEIANRRTFVDTRDIPGLPDGMTVDADDHVWVAFWDGHCIVRYDPEGREVLRIEFPVKKVSCPAFGGPDHTDVFVTTAGGQDKSDNGRDAGALFHLKPGFRGHPEYRSRLGLPSID